MAWNGDQRSRSYYQQQQEAERIAEQRISDEQIDAWLALAEKATEGPWSEWENVEGDLVVASPVKDFAVCRIQSAEWVSDRETADATFIAAAREALPALCREVRALRAEITRLREGLNAIAALGHDHDADEIDADMAFMLARAALSPATE